MEEGTGFVPIPTKAVVEPKAELESGENPQPSYDVNDSLDTYDGVLQGKNDDLPTNHQVLDSEGEPPKRVRYELDKPVRNRRTDSVDLSRVILHPMSVLSNDIGKVTDVDVEDNVDVEPPQKEVKSLQFLQVLLGRSSVHAVSRMGQAQTKRKRAFWLLVLTASFFGCCYEVHDFLTVYFQYPVLIDAVMTRETPFPSFPAVTICNLNRMKKQHYDCVKKGENWQECNQISILPQLEIMTRTLVFSERTLVTKVTNKTTPSRRKYQKEAQEFLNAYSKIDTETRKCFGYNVEELVKRCTFDWNVCTHRNFTYFYSMQYGNCYTFKNTPPDRTRHGLELDLYLDIYSHLDLTSASGIRVVVHDPDEDPNPSEDGVTISPGFETHLSMSLSSVHRLSAPYRDRCRTYDRTSNHTDQRSQFDCIRTCQQRTSFTLCGCIDPVMTSETFQMTPCDLKNDTQTTCLDQVLEDMSENGLPCNCPLPCVTMTYNLQISSSVLLEDYLYYSDGSFGWTRDPQCEIEYPPYPFRKKRWLTEKRSKSYAKLKVFFGTNEHTVYAQRAMFNDSEFWAHLGGNMGLWLGLSLVAAFEYVEGVGLFLSHCFKRSVVI